MIRAYSGPFDPHLAVSVLAAEVVASEADLLSSEEDASSSFYFMLVLLTRNEPLNLCWTVARDRGRLPGGDWSNAMTVLQRRGFVDCWWD